MTPINPYKRPRTVDPLSHKQVNSSQSRSKSVPRERSSFVKPKRPSAVALQPTNAWELLLQSKQRTQDYPLHLVTHPVSNLQQFSLGRGVYELAGPGGTGKTQIALSLCAQVAHTYTTPVRSLYVSLKDTQLNRIVNRLRQIVSERNPPAVTSSVLESIWTKACPTPEDLFALLRDSIPEKILELQPRLIVLDSIADIFRSSDWEHTDRAFCLFYITQLLHRIIQQSRSTPLSILVINQVTADFSGSSSSSWNPALGLSWANCSNSRFRVDRQETTQAGQTTYRRTLTLRDSPEYPQITVPFRITATGTEILDDQSK